MCGIFGVHCSNRPLALDVFIKFLQQGLKVLEYRGYDSCGMAVDSNDSGSQIELIKCDGKASKDLVRVLEQVASSLPLELRRSNYTGIAHTRWATHGKICVENAHPQTSSSDNGFVVVHNGQITNFAAVRTYVVKETGWEFTSETDTECIAKLAHLFYSKHPNQSFPEIVQQVCQVVEGSYALLFKSSYFPNEIVATKCGSPLHIGIKCETIFTCETIKSASIPCHFSPNSNLPEYTNVVRERIRSSSEEASAAWESAPSFPSREESKRYHPGKTGDPISYIFSSSIHAIQEHTRNIVELKDFDIAHTLNHTITISNCNPQGDKERQVVYKEICDAEKKRIDDNYSCITEKEIHEQSETIMRALGGRIDEETGQIRLGGLREYHSHMRECHRFYMLGMGTSTHAAMATKDLLMEMSGKCVTVLSATSFVDQRLPISKMDVVIVISQSGETADTIKALDYCRKKGAITVGITNVSGSTICNRTHCGIHVNAGTEIGVASTKAYTSQFVCLTLLALAMGEDFISNETKIREVVGKIKELPKLAEKCLTLKPRVIELADSILAKRESLFKEQGGGRPQVRGPNNSMFVLGRGFQQAAANETALKIQEISYIHATGLCASELKHGPLALVQSDMPVILFVMQDRFKEHCLQAMHQLCSRGCVPFLVVNEGMEAEILESFQDGAQKPFMIAVPKSHDCLQGILNIIPMQLLAMYLAQKLGHEVDTPRNLAKSVTV